MAAGSLREFVQSEDVVLVSAGDYDGEGITEGPVWHPAGYLTFVRHHLSKLFRWSPDTDVTEVIRENTGYGNGCTLDLQGRLVMCEGENRRISRTEHDGSVIALTTEWHGNRYNKPNDVVCRSDGSLFFTDPAGRVDESKRQLGFSGVFRIGVDGEVHVATDECEYPNGLAFSPDESVLYVAITRRDAQCLSEGPKGAECRHRLIRAFDVAPDGTLANNRIFANLYAPIAGGPDGLKVDEGGRVYCASAGGVWVFDRDGDLLGVIATPAKARNLAFGGPDNRSLFICAGESVYRVMMAVQGIGTVLSLRNA
jgi:gluconolactonase